MSRTFEKEMLSANETFKHEDVSRTYRQKREKRRDTVREHSLTILFGEEHYNRELLEKIIKDFKELIKLYKNSTNLKFYENAKFFGKSHKTIAFHKFFYNTINLLNRQRNMVSQRANG